MSKIALITGANKGLGFESARQLGAQGVTILVGARDEKKAEQAAGLLKAENIDALRLKLDVSNPADWTAAAKFIEQRYGHLDILINNAGISGGEDLYINDSATVSQATLRSVFDTNFFGLIGLTQALLPLLKKSAAGRIINVSSILGSLTLHATPDSPIAAAKGLAYNSSKSALNAFTIHLADLLKDTKVKVFSAHPGWVKTDLGTDAAPMEIVDGAKTQVALALAPDDAPSGTYTHLGQTLPW